MSAIGSWQKVSSIFSLLETAMSGYRLSLVGDRQSPSVSCILRAFYALVYFWSIGAIFRTLSSLGEHLAEKPTSCR